MKRVYICSPYNGDVNANVLYARACMRHSLLKGEAPYAPHLLYTQPQVLNDSREEERKIGMAAGHAYLLRSPLVQGKIDIMTIGCQLIAVYFDRGISKGMMEDIQIASEAGVPIEFRSFQKNTSVWNEIQERNITSMWIDENERIKQARNEPKTNSPH